MNSLDWAGLQARWVDVAMLVWLALSMLIGLVRGLAFELMSLIGLVVAWFGAEWAAPHVEPWLPAGATGSTLRHGLALVGVFVGLLILWGVGARLLRMLLRLTPLNGPDRLLGAGFGALRGVVVLLVLAAFAGHTPVAASGPWQRSQGGAWLNEVLRGLAPLLPEDLARHLPARRP